MDKRLIHVLFFFLIFYLIGSFPSGYVFFKLKTNKDIRTFGKRRNIGATNVFIEGGPYIGIFTLIADILKGAIPVVFVKFYYKDNILSSEMVIILSALFAVLGHIFPIFLNFKGGKGLATTLGALLAIFPEILISYLFIFLILIPIFKRPALIGMILFVIFPFILYFQNYSQIYVGTSSFFSVVYLFISLNHIKSLIKGEEYWEVLKKLENVKK